MDKEEVIDVMGAWLASRLTIVDEKRKRQRNQFFKKANEYVIRDNQQIRLTAEERLAELGLGSLGEDS